MIRLIILAIIFFALYPYIGDGLKDFVNDFNTEALMDFVEKTADAVRELYARITEKKGFFNRLFS